jgi:hypothetical protein
LLPGLFVCCGGLFVIKGQSLGDSRIRIRLVVYPLRYAGRQHSVQKHHESDQSRHHGGEIAEQYGRHGGLMRCPGRGSIVRIRRLRNIPRNQQTPREIDGRKGAESSISKIFLGVITAALWFMLSQAAMRSAFVIKSATAGTASQNVSIILTLQ